MSKYTKTCLGDRSKSVKPGTNFWSPLPHYGAISTLLEQEAAQNSRLFERTSSTPMVMSIEQYLIELELTARTLFGTFYRLVEPYAN